MAEQIALNTDCMAYMRTLPDKSFDLAIVDPPYGIGEDGGKKRSKLVVQKNGKRVWVPDGNYQKTGFDAVPPGREYFEELFRVSKEQIIWGANYFELPITLSCHAPALSFGTNATMVPTSQTVKLHFAP